MLHDVFLGSIKKFEQAQLLKHKMEGENSGNKWCKQYNQHCFAWRSTNIVKLIYLALIERLTPTLMLPDSPIPNIAKIIFTCDLIARENHIRRRFLCITLNGKNLAIDCELFRSNQTIQCHNSIRPTILLCYPQHNHIFKHNICGLKLVPDISMVISQSQRYDVRTFFIELLHYFIEGLVFKLLVSKQRSRLPSFCCCRKQLSKDHRVCRHP